MAQSVLGVKLLSVVLEGVVLLFEQLLVEHRHTAIV